MSLCLVDTWQCLLSYPAIFEQLKHDAYFCVGVVYMSCCVASIHICIQIRYSTIECGLFETVICVLEMRDIRNRLVDWYLI